MIAVGRRWLGASLIGVLLVAAEFSAGSTDPAEELLVTDSTPALRGGRLTVALVSEAKTFNPVVAVDGGSRDLIGRMSASLIAIDRRTLRTEPALTKSWTASPDGRLYTLHLRQGIRFSDGHPFDADDVVFSFEAYLDERNHSPQRDLLLVGGKPIAVRKVDSHTVTVELEQPYAAAERLFDGIAMLPRHLLQQVQGEGRLSQAWDIHTPAAQIAGLGPFRLKSYVPGERTVLERNPAYWKADRQGTRLPYLDEITFLIVPNDDAQVLRFRNGETDVVSRLKPQNFAILAKEENERGFRLHDLGPGLEYSFLFFNLNGDAAQRGLSAVAREQRWFSQVAFRQAISSAIDRDGIVRLVYGGRAAPLRAHLTPGNTLWVNTLLPPPRRSVDRARALLRAAGFTLDRSGALRDGAGEAVEFSILASAGNAARVEMATIIQEDLRPLGIRAQVVPLEHRTLVERILQTHDYEACVLALGGGGDADPNVEMNVWLSSAPMHLWNLGQKSPATPWEAEIDRLMRAQLTTLDPAERKRLVDRVQELVAENLPLIPLVAPHVLVGAKQALVNFRPAVLENHVLWNADELAWRP